MALVLCTGVYPTLVETRKMLLQSVGHFVVVPDTALDIEISCRRFAFDVAIICQTASAGLKRQWSSLVRANCPSAKILELYQLNTGIILGDADAWLEVPSSAPTQLIDLVAVLTEQKPVTGGGDGSTSEAGAPRGRGKVNSNCILYGPEAFCMRMELVWP
jgi:hypothetical protein